MSIKYPDLIDTNFPDNIDEFERKRNPNNSEISDINYYQNLISQNKIEEASSFMQSKPNLKQVIIDAFLFNKILDSIKAIQRFYISDVKPYLDGVKNEINQLLNNTISNINDKLSNTVLELEQKVKDVVVYKGAYDENQDYKKYDLVTHTINDNTFVYYCIQDATSGKINDENYFVKLTIKGEKGENGTGLIPKGIYKNGVTYKKYELVAKDKCLYYADKETVNSPPHLDWVKIMEMSTAVSWDDLLGKPNVMTQEEFGNTLTIINNNINSKLGKTETAKNSKELDGHEVGYFATSQSINSINNELVDIKQQLLTTSSFDFDNISELKGSKKTTAFLSDGNIEESIILTGNNRKIATRKTEFLSDGRIRVNIKVYKEDGSSILKESTSVTTFRDNGEIEEVVS